MSRRAAAWRAGSSWRYLLTLYTVACLIEAMFLGQMGAFTPLYLPRLGIAPQDVAAWTGAIVAISSLVGLPFLPFWGALADRYARQPVLVRAFVMHLVAGILALLAANIWLFLLARAVMSLALGITGLMLTTLHGADVGTATGLVIAGGGLTTALFGPLFGTLADRWGHWRVLLASACVSVLLWPLPALAGDILSFGLAWALVNGAVAGTFTLSFNVLADSTTPQARGRVMIFSYLPVVSGQAIGPALGSLVTPISLFAVFPLAAVLTASGIAALLLANRQPVAATPERANGQGLNPGKVRCPRCSVLRTYTIRNIGWR